MIVPRTTKEFLSNFEVDKTGEVKVVKMNMLDYALLENLAGTNRLNVSVPVIENTLIIIDSGVESKINAIKN